MKHYKGASRVLSALLALVVCFGMLPRPASAAVQEDPGTVVVQEDSVPGDAGTAGKGDAVEADTGAVGSDAEVTGGDDTGVTGGAPVKKSVKVAVMKAVRAASASCWSAADEARARELMAGMTVEEKVGQLFLLHWPSSGAGSAAQAKSVVASYKPGGLIVFAAMFENGATPASVKSKIAEVQAASKVPLVISVDEEGGKVASGRRVVRISDKPAFRSEPFIGPQELKDKGGIPAVTAEYTAMADLLKSLGINMNHAPVADTSTSDGVIYGRTWGGTYNENAEFVAAAAAALESNGMGSSLKHFPGYGDSVVDTHTGIAVDNRDEATFRNYLVPFKAGIDAGCQAVMVTHNTITCLDETTPTSLSPKTYSLLRNDLGFDGLALTDDLGMGAVTKFVGSKNASLLAIQAGADMVITSKQADIPVVIAAAKDGTLSKSRLDEACFRVLCWKASHGLLQEVEPSYEASWTPAGGSSPTNTGTFASMWSLAASSGGTVRLHRDISVSGSFAVKKNTVLDLNGKTMTASGSAEHLFDLYPDISLTVKDGVADRVKTSRQECAQAGAAGYSASTRTVTWYEREGDKIYRCTADLSACGGINASGFKYIFKSNYIGGANLVLDGGRFTINGDAVVYCGQGSKTVNNGAALVGCSGTGIRMFGTVELNGGYIAGNKGLSYTSTSGTQELSGGGVYAGDGSSLTITGGVIAGNTANYGGGVVSWGTVDFQGGTVTGNTAMDESVGGGGLYMGEGSNLTIFGGTVSFNSTGYGGGIRVNGAIDVRDGEIFGNKATYHGGGVYMHDGSSFTVTGGTIDSNTAKSSGGGLYLSNGGQVSNAVIGSNSADRNGGGVYSGGALTLTGCMVTGNTAKSNGGGLYLANGGGISGSTVKSNSASYGGGVCSEGTLTLTGGEVSGNTAANYGGGVYLTYDGQASGTAISGNRSKNDGGGVYARKGFTMEGGEVSGNTAVNFGGGLYLGKGGQISDAVIDGNAAKSGGGVYSDGAITLTGCTVSSNTVDISGIIGGTAFGSGGGVHAKGILTMTGGEVTGNTGIHGGGLFAIGGGSISGTEISNNSAYYGGGVYPGGSFSVKDSSVTGNSAREAGGGIYLDAGGSTVLSGAVSVTGNVAGTGGVEREDNVWLSSGEQVLGVSGALADGSVIGVTGKEDQKVLALASGGYSLTDGDLSRLSSDVCELELVKEADGVYLRISRENSVQVTIHDVKRGASGAGDEDNVLAKRVAKGRPLPDTTVAHYGSSASTSKDAFYVKGADGTLTRFDPAVPLEEDIELYTYGHGLSFVYEGGRKDLYVREGQAPGADALVVDGTDLSGAGFLDAGGQEVPFKSLLEVQERSYEFYRVTVEDEALGLEAWALAGLDHVIELPVREASKWDVSGVGAEKVIRGYTGDDKAVERITVQAVDSPVRVKCLVGRATNDTTYLLSVILDGKVMTLSEIKNLHGYGLFGNEYYRYMLAGGADGADAAGLLEPFGFDPEASSLGQVFANTNKAAYDEVYAAAMPEKDPGGGWRIPFAFSGDSPSYDKCRMFYLSSPLPGKPGEGVSAASLANSGFWSVTVRDFVNEDDPANDASCVRYAPNGGGVTLRLPEATPGEWKLNPGYNATVEFDRTSEPGWVTVTLSKVGSRVTLYRGTSSYTRYSVQYYAYADLIDWDAEDTTHTLANLEMIDTSVTGRIPTNGGSMVDGAVKKIWLNADGSVKTKKGDLEPIYKTRYSEYAEAPTLLHSDRLYMDPNYTLDELWILVAEESPGTEATRTGSVVEETGGENPGAGAVWNKEPNYTDKNGDSWIVYTKKDFEGVVDDLRDLYMTSDVKFANDPEYSDRTVLIKNDSVVRFVYNTTSSEDGAENDYNSVPVQFYDYDISDGKSTSHTNTASRDRKGINSVLPGSDAGKNQLAFGNKELNAYVDQTKAKLSDGYFLNITNVVKIGAPTDTFGGCAFGIVESKLDENGCLVYDPAIMAPKLFDEAGGEDQPGKTYIGGRSLNFSRDGDNYTLKNVLKDGVPVKHVGYGIKTEDPTGDLSKFEKVHKNGIYSNSFWPMDDAYDNGENGGWAGHDPMFGGKLLNGWVPSDDGKDHNSYFGMHFDLSFKLQPDYVGLLDYCFFGDDDMWVFLDGELILDIGGVHSSVGEYVDLWNYIKDDDGRLIRENGKFRDDFFTVTEHKLSVHYTERGASGSTCWMRFTIPEAEFEEGGQFTRDKFGTLLLSKLTKGRDGDGGEAYMFHIDLKDRLEPDRNSFSDFEYKIMSNGELSDSLYMERGHLDVELKAGDQLMVKNIPVGTKFVITEEPGDTYAASYQVDGEAQAGSSASGTITANKDSDVVCTNSFDEFKVELPKTGGTGTGPYIMAGSLFMAVALLMAVRRRRRR